jgi:4-diphosphocytidyl-2-C-methyl-D-erythritol kinase
MVLEERMKVIYTKAYAKLNLSLDVLSKRPDGYHDLCMVMQSVEHHDDVSILLNMEGQFYAQSDRRYLPNDERNIALKAARLFLEETGHAGMGASVRLRKRIPVCAGLGGGSSDAAATLIGLNDMFGGVIPENELMSLGKKLGADVPFCIKRGLRRALGIGELLERLPDLPECFFTVAKGIATVSTKSAFEALDKIEGRIIKKSDDMIKAIINKDIKTLSSHLYNAFEIQNGFDKRIKDVLLENNALNAVMSGSGPSVFGIFDNQADAEKADKALKRAGFFSFCCRPESNLPDMG